MASGIYRWIIDRSSENKVPLVYIGQARDIDRRTNQHIRAIVSNDTRISNARLINAINHYGDDSITFEVLEYCTIDKLTIRELYWYNLHKKSTGFELANFIAPSQNPMDDPELAKKARERGGLNDKGTPAKPHWLEKDGERYYCFGVGSFCKQFGLPYNARQGFFKLFQGKSKSYKGFRVVDE